MSGEVVIRSRPGESVEDFIDRIVAAAPAPSTGVMDRLRALLPVDEALPDIPAPRQRMNAAA